MHKNGHCSRTSSKNGKMGITSSSLPRRLVLGPPAWPLKQETLESALHPLNSSGCFQLLPQESDPFHLSPLRTLLKHGFPSEAPAYCPPAAHQVPVTCRCDTLSSPSILITFEVTGAHFCLSHQIISKRILFTTVSQRLEQCLAHTRFPD